MGDHLEPRLNHSHGDDKTCGGIHVVLAVAGGGYLDVEACLDKGVHLPLLLRVAAEEGDDKLVLKGGAGTFAVDGALGAGGTVFLGVGGFWTDESNDVICVLQAL